jgi:putative membrane protein
MVQFRDLLLHLIVNGLAVVITAAVLPGIHVNGDNRAVTFIVLAIVFGLVNGLVKPVSKVLAFPLTCLTVGLFAFVLNALLLILASWIADQVVTDAIVIDNFLWALLGAIIMGFVHGVLNWGTKQVFPDEKDKHTVEARYSR